MVQSQKLDLDSSEWKVVDGVDGGRVADLGHDQHPEVSGAPASGRHLGFQIEWREPKLKLRWGLDLNADSNVREVVLTPAGAPALFEWVVEMGNLCCGSLVLESPP